MSEKEIDELDLEALMDAGLAFEDRDVAWCRRWFDWRVNNLIERYRARITPSGPVQLMVYNEKIDQATDYLTDAASDGTKYPLLVAEAEAKDITVQEVADSIIVARTEWLSKITVTEKMRFVHCATVNRARKPEKMGEVIATVKEELANL